MRSKKQAPDNTDRQVRTMRGTGPAAKDAASKQLVRLAGKTGNKNLSDSIDDSAASRDRLLEFITGRLQTLRGAQLHERAEIKDVRQWFRSTARGVDGFHLPDTTRWHEAARRYQRAAEALTRGDLGRGARLIETALEAERTAFDSAPNQVREELDTNERSAAAVPAEVPHLVNERSCPATAMPGELHKLADSILRTYDEMEKSPPLNTRRRRRWWEEEEEEEEEDGEGDGKK